MAEGFVSLVGAGPGDPGLLTVRGMQRLQQAEVVLYDRLLDPSLLDYAPPEAERIYVGKQAQRHALSQQEINDLLVAHGQAGRRVVRLKGGDPFVFGRGGEEAEALRAAGVPFEVVPGVTSAVAAPAYAGIPVTHRGYTSAFTVVTGHEDPSKPETSIDWEGLARSGGTLVFLMGVENLPGIVQRLVEHGRPGHTPVALVRRGTWPDQEVVTGTLQTIVAQLAGRTFDPPAVIVVGGVVQLREELRWWDARPLSGTRVLVTRAREQTSGLARRLADLGAAVLEAPAIRIGEPASYAELDAALLALHQYAWVVFTSANAVQACFRRLAALGRDTRSFGGTQVAAVGPGTTAALRGYGITSDYEPPQALTSAVAEGLIARGVRGRRVLLPRTDLVGEDLAGQLAAAGATVHQVVAYRTAMPDHLDPGVAAALRAGDVDVVTFASASTVRNLVRLLGNDAASALARSKVVTIGPVTSRAAREAGLRVDAEATEHTIPGLVQAVLNVAAGPQAAIRR